MDSPILQHSHNSNSYSGSPPGFPRSRYEPGSASHPTPPSESSLDSGPPPGFEEGFGFPQDNPPSPPHGSIRKTKTRKKENNKLRSSIKKRQYIRKTMKVASPGRKQEIYLLNDMILFRNKYDKCPYDSRYDMRKFYKYWIQRREMFVDKPTLITKMVDLHERFVRNYHKRLISGNGNIEKWMDPTEVRVYQLSYRIWGDDQDYSSERTISDVHSTHDSFSTDRY